MKLQSSTWFKMGALSLPVLACLVPQGCKPRSYNEAESSTQASLAQPKTAALTAALIPFWPTPKSAAEIRTMPSASSLGVSASLWQKVLEDALTDPETGRPLTLSSPECARSVDSWRVTAARLALYEVDLPGNVMSWQTLALQRESDLAQRMQLHVTVQPWCVSDRLGRSDFVHTLDHAFLFTFDLSWPSLSKSTQDWLEDLTLRSRSEKQITVSAERAVLPYAKTLMDVSSSKNGRAALVAAWNTALQTDVLQRSEKYPDANWSSARGSLLSKRTLKSSGASNLTHPTLQANPSALNNFFAQMLTEKNLLRIRAHITEGVGTSHAFLRWEKQAGKMQRVALQTTSARWDRSANTVTLSPLLNRPQPFAKLGSEQPAAQENIILLKDVDSESTPMANDMSLQDLISLNERIIDHERTSVHSTRCVSCHAVDDALNFAREGKPVSQRGIAAAQLTLSGVSQDGRTILNLRTLRMAEADAKRFEEEHAHVRNPQSANNR